MSSSTTTPNHDDDNGEIEWRKDVNHDDKANGISRSALTAPKPRLQLRSPVI